MPQCFRHENPRSSPRCHKLSQPIGSGAGDSGSLVRRECAARTCGRCPLVSRVTAQQVYAIASGWQRRVRATRVRRAALIRSRAQTAPRSRSAMHAIDGVRGAVNVVRRRNRRRFRDRAISVCDRDLGPSHHTGQALILIPRATAAVVLRRPVPRSRADSPIAQIRANDRDRGLGPVGLADNREEDSRPTGVIRPSGRRRRRPTGSAPRRRTDPRTELG